MNIRKGPHTYNRLDRNEPKSHDWQILAWITFYYFNVHFILFCTSNLVDVLKRKTKGQVCGSLWWQNSIQSLQEGLSRGISLLPFNGPSLEPAHIAWGLNHVVSMPPWDGDKRHSLGVVPNFLDIFLYFSLDFVETALMEKKIVNSNFYFPVT